jgi:hypothetical protein
MSDGQQIDQNSDSVSKLTPAPKNGICSGSRNSEIFQREDWTAFRTIQGLCRRAGVPEDELARTVIKELVDNALDAAGDCELSLEDDAAIIQDNGPGIDGDDETVAKLFSLNRPQQSSKFLRLPTRGCLGNGLRVIAGAVAATDGNLYVSTRGRRLRIVVDPVTGESSAESAGSYKGSGTRIEVRLGDPLSLIYGDLFPGQVAMAAAWVQEKRYNGRTSPHWYNAESFHELLLAIQSDVTVKDFVAGLEGCFTAARSITEGFGRRAARSLSRQEAAEILARAKASCREVNPERLGSIGRKGFPGEYCRQASFAVFDDGVRLPVVVEAWAVPDKNPDAIFLINGTPATVQAGAAFYPKEKSTLIAAPGFRLTVKSGKTGMLVHVNIFTPYMPVISDGKAPALGAYGGHLVEPIEKAIKRARKTVPVIADTDVKSVVFAHMNEEIIRVSGNRRYRFNWRQVFYRLRPIIKAETGKDLEWTYLSQTLTTEYEEKFGEERLSYREPRGTFYTPHSKASVSLGTLAIEEYRRPEWRFNKVLYIEKEGFFEALKSDGWPERHDCALMTSKGQPTRAARDLIDVIGQTDEPVQVFCLHDCDAAGTIIYQSLQNETRARPERSIEIDNLGLDVDEALRLEAGGVISEIEDISPDRRLPVADYAEKHAEWFQSHRVELNAFTTEDFIKWLDGKMEECDSEKVVPPKKVLNDSYEAQIRENLTQQITEKVLAAAKIDDQVDSAMRKRAAAIRAKKKQLDDEVRQALLDDPQDSWDHVIKTIANDDTFDNGKADP